MKNSREMFEQWAYEKRVRGVSFSVEKFKAHGEQLYKNPELQSQWNAWQQATFIQRKSALRISLAVSAALIASGFIALFIVWGAING
ncbi:hypothetical protein VC136_24510 [Citrobacter freundii]|nr:hypothetical protein [Citrobacter freundii]MEB2760007.1 hypothetical protein [Citrobacter freundii]